MRRLAKTQNSALTVDAPRLVNTLSFCVQEM
jgi:hypothetical protein